jgi:hypothetical protein
MAWVQNKGTTERGPFTVKHTIPRSSGEVLQRASARPNAAAEVGQRNMPGSITFGARGSATDCLEVHDADLRDGPLARAIANRNDSLVIVAGPKERKQ